MDLTNANGFRGSTAFFALLLAGASGTAADQAGADCQAGHATTFTGNPVRIQPAAPADRFVSKFSRRTRPPVMSARTRSALA